MEFTIQDLTPFQQVADLAALDLAGRGLRQRLDEPDATRPLEACQPLPDVIDERLGRNLTAGDHGGGDELPPAFVSDAEDRRLDDGGMRRERALDLFGRDVFASGDDDLLEPAG